MKVNVLRARGCVCDGARRVDCPVPEHAEYARDLVARRAVKAEAREMATVELDDDDDPTLDLGRALRGIK